jgi:hypothetical protein
MIAMPAPRKKTYVRSSPVWSDRTPRPVSITISPTSVGAASTMGSSKSLRSVVASAAAGR